MEVSNAEGYDFRIERRKKTVDVDRRRDVGKLYAKDLSYSLDSNDGDRSNRSVHG